VAPYPSVGWDGVLQTFCLAWPQTMIFSFQPPELSRITGMSHCTQLKGNFSRKKHWFLNVELKNINATEKDDYSWAPVATPVILATKEAEIRGIEVQCQPRQLVRETPSWKHRKQNRAGGAAQQ
jgi:hypothetical protein